MKIFKGCADGVHKFQARYNIKPPPLENLRYRGTDLETFLDGISEKTYVKDVCVRCGKEVCK